MITILERPRLQKSIAWWATSNAARQATLPHGSFWQAKLTTSGNLSNFLTHVTTFHDLRMTLMTHGDDILTALRPSVKTIWQTRRLLVKTLWRILLWLMTTLWLLRMTSLMTHVTELTTKSNEQGNYIERLVMGAIPGDDKDDKVMTTATNGPKRRHGEDDPCKYCWWH